MPATKPTSLVGAAPAMVLKVPAGAPVEATVTSNVAAFGPSPSRPAVSLYSDAQPTSVDSEASSAGPVAVAPPCSATDSNQW